jgi:asparagine synthase (glutamine-hydrolysing)
MCGIAGLISAGPRPDTAELVGRMTAALAHRGPDGEGRWIDGEAALGHRRLAIIDVAGGAQPLVNETGSVRVVCNGEIYNYRELRAELEARGHRFQTASDCETIVHLYEDEGPDAIARLHGMFALAIWDRAARRLVLARDRIGIKPLFYASGSRGFGFASEIKALVAAGLTECRVDPGALRHYLSCGYVPRTDTIYQDVQRVAPGELLIVEGESVRRRPYWDWQPGVAHRSEAGAEEELRSLLTTAVREHLVADVPVGAFLSGGIDSSVVSCLAAAASPTPLRTFSVTFPEDRVFDEARFSRQVARQIGSVHTEIPLTRMDILSALEPALDYLDEPFADPSLLPCFAIAREARRHVKVVLSGDGADELFGGYTKYLGETYAARVPRPLIWLLAQVSALGPSGRGNRLEEAVRQLRRLTDGGGIPDTGRRYARWAQVCGEAEVRALVPDLSGERPASELFAAEARRFGALDHGDSINRMLYTDCRLGLPGDMLAKVDISSMANALEVRVPFLDHRLIECAFRIPGRWKIRALRGKRVLRRAFRDVLPPEIRRRGKRGFEPPVGEWFRTELRDLFWDVIDTGGRFLPCVRRDAVETLFRQHETRRADRSKELWAVFGLHWWAGRHRTGI